MPKYIVNKLEDNRGYHEVHEISCNHLPKPWNREELALFSNCRDAVQLAKQKNPTWKVDGCYYCSEACHQY